MGNESNSANLASDRAVPPAIVAAHPQLVRLIEAFCGSPDPPQLYVRLVRLVRWTKKHNQSGFDFTALRQFLGYLESHPEARLRFQEKFGELVKHTRSISLLAESGVPSDRSLISEMARRLVGRILPSAKDDSDASKLIVALYSSRHDAARFLATPPELFERLVAVLTPADAQDFWDQPRNDLREALRLLAARVCSLGLKPEMRERSTASGIFHSPFFQFVSRTESVIRPEDPNQIPERLAAWRTAVERCREEMAEVYRHMETSGVSAELVFDLKKIDACLKRMESLIETLDPAPERGPVPVVQALLGHLVAGRVADSSMGTYLRENLDLLARKTVERTGRSGEHYIAHNREEYWQMWRAAIGGGLLTVFTAAIKLRIVDAHLPPFVEGFVSGTNYAVSFVILQILHLVLATKQPAATAATFAGIVRNNRGVERSSKITDFVARITRTQLAAALGNVLAVSVGALMFEKLWSLALNRPYLPPATAEHVYETLNVFDTNTAIYAAVTGVVLWMAALAGGWCENFAVFYRLPEAIAEHPLGLQVGTARTRKIARVLDRNLGGWATSIVLGYLLGFTPELGQFFGLPLDVRHVTLSTGQLALAAASFGTVSLRNGWFHRAVGGIGIIFVLNLTVSFTIAAVVALRAYNVRFAEQLEILRYLCRAILQAPLRFLLPVREKPPARGPSSSGPASPKNEPAAAD
jgi:site-specific recombinase